MPLVTDFVPVADDPADGTRLNEKVPVALVALIDVMVSDPEPPDVPADHDCVVLGTRGGLRYALAGAVLLASALTGTLVWESVNPVSLTQRALIFGGIAAWGAAAAVFLFDLLVAPRGWCGHVCPAGATYALIGAKSLVRVSARHASRCDDCGDCFAVCPEPQVITPALKAKGGAGPVITDRDCTLCGRCIDVCPPRVFAFTHRFDTRKD